MDNPGIFNLGDRTVTAALTSEVITEGTDLQGTAREFISDLDGTQAIGLQVRFSYGAGGTSCKVDIETSLDQGVTWIPVARFAFLTTTAKKVMNLSALTPKIAAYTPVSLSDDVAVDGIIGDRLRAVVTSVGTYSGDTSVSVRAIVR